MDSHTKLPFAPGDSPFRVKGQAYRGIMKRAERLPGGLPAFLEGMPGPQFRAFFQQQFLAASWYDVFPILTSATVAARLVGMPLLEYVARAARQQATEDIHGIYKLLLKLTSPQQVALRLPRVSVQYFSFGSVDLRKEAPRHVEGVRTGVPLPLVPWYVASNDGYVSAALEQAGARHPRVLARPPLVTGEAHGVAIADVTFAIVWD